MRSPGSSPWSRRRSTINFHDPRPQTGIIRPPVTELTAYNVDQVVAKVAVGALILFPAWLPHSVDLNMSGANRVSVSFNAMSTGFAERLAKPLWGER
jgi:ectoine hydroxylase-related dioxygenase (phytanoyl-CoA dioxygenase family)